MDPVTIPDDHKVVVILNHAARFGRQSGSNIPISIKEPGQSEHKQIAVVKKTLWSWCIESTLEVHRIAFDLFHGQKRLIRVGVADSGGRMLDAEWGDDIVTQPILSKNLSSTGPPLAVEVATPISSLIGIQTALEALAQGSPLQREWSEQEHDRQSKKHGKLHGARLAIDNKDLRAVDSDEGLEDDPMDGRFIRLVRQNKVVPEETRAAEGCDSTELASSVEMQDLSSPASPGKTVSPSFVRRKPLPFPPNRGVVIMFTDFADESEAIILKNKFDMMVNTHNETAKRLKEEDPFSEFLPIDHADLYLINTHAIGEASAVTGKSITATSPLTSWSSVCRVAGEQLISAAHCAALSVYDLVSTTVSGIPMKEEAQQGQSVNYDVELLHPRLAHRQLEALGMVGPEGFLKDVVGNCPYPTFRLAWATPSPKSKWNLFPRTRCALRCTPAAVNSRPSICLTSYLLAGRNVMLEVVRKGPAEALDPNVNTKLISHSLIAHAGRVYIHAIDIAKIDVLDHIDDLAVADDLSSASSIESSGESSATDSGTISGNGSRSNGNMFIRRGTKTVSGNSSSSSSAFVSGSSGMETTSTEASGAESGSACSSLAESSRCVSRASRSSSRLGPRSSSSLSTSTGGEADGEFDLDSDDDGSVTSMRTSSSGGSGGSSNNDNANVSLGSGSLSGGSHRSGHISGGALSTSSGSGNLSSGSGLVSSSGESSDVSGSFSASSISSSILSKFSGLSAFSSANSSSVSGSSRKGLSSSSGTASSPLSTDVELTTSGDEKMEVDRVSPSGTNSSVISSALSSAEDSDVSSISKTSSGTNSSRSTSSGTTSSNTTSSGRTLTDAASIPASPQGVAVVTLSSDEAHHSDGTIELSDCDVKMIHLSSDSDAKMSAGSETEFAVPIGRPASSGPNSSTLTARNIRKSRSGTTSSVSKTSSSAGVSSDSASLWSDSEPLVYASDSTSASGAAMRSAESDTAGAESDATSGTAGASSSSTMRSGVTTGDSDVSDEAGSSKVAIKREAMETDESGEDSAEMEDEAESADEESSDDDVDDCLYGSESDEEECSGAVPDSEDAEAQMVSGLRLADFCQLIKSCTLRPPKQETKDQEPATALAGVGNAACEQPLRRLYLLTRHWPMSANETIIHNMKDTFGDLLTIPKQPELSTADMDKCKQIMYDWVTLKYSSDMLIMDPVPTHLTFDINDRERLYSEATMEMAGHLSNFVTFSDKHLMLFHVFLQKTNIEEVFSAEDVKITEDTVMRGPSKLERIALKKPVMPKSPPTETVASPWASRSNSPLPKKARKTKDMWRPNESVSVYDLMYGDKERQMAMSWHDFVGRAEAGSRPAQLYKGIDFTSAPGKGEVQ